MNEKILEKMMQDSSKLCARAEDLVTYLYGEASEREASDFERHMIECTQCSNELAAFRSVREGVVEWRNQSLPSFETSRATMPAFAETRERKRSALAALREFFTLSPAWLRAATAMAVVAICVLVVFTVARFNTPSKQVVVQTVLTSPVKPEVARTVKAAEEIRQDENQQAQVKNRPSVVAVRDNRSSSSVKNRRSADSAPMSARNRTTPNKVNESQDAVRQQLAELVQRTKEDDNLPRLSDLVDDSNQ